MSDVFVSYKAEDLERLRPLVAALEAAGLSVWWDARIDGGERWRERIERELDAARCVVVAWTRRSVGPAGGFVREEAARAQRRGVYLPVRLDPVEPPLGFGEVQALPLLGWTGGRDDARLGAVLASARAIVAGERPASYPLSAPSWIGRRALITGGGAAAALVAAGAGWRWWRDRPAPGPDRLAVLPFANLSGDPAQSYFSEGIAEELRAALSRIPGLAVIGGFSSQAVADLTPRQVAAKLGVANILTGSVRRSPGIVRVGAHLVEGTSGVERWSDTYDRSPTDVLALESDIAASVADALSLRLGAAAAELELGGTRDAAAHDLYLKAKAISRSSDKEDDMRRVDALAAAALAIDPNYAQALVLRANGLSQMSGFFAHDARSSREGMAAAERLARQAVGAAPQLPAAHAALGKTLASRLELGSALEQYRKAEALGSGSYLLTTFSVFLAGIGRAAQGIAMAERAVTLDPLNPGCYNTLAYVLTLCRRFADAATAARQVLKLAPQRYYANYYIAVWQLSEGDASAALRTIAAMPEDEINRVTIEAIATGRLGRTAASDRLLARLRTRWGDAANFQYAEILAQRGRASAALDALEAAYGERDPGLATLAADALLDPVRREPRFEALLARLDVH